MFFSIIAVIPIAMSVENFFSPNEPFNVTIFIIGLILETISITIVVHYTRQNSRNHDNLLEDIVLKRAFNNKGIVKDNDFYVSPLSRWRSNRTIKRFLKNGTIEIKEHKDEGTIYFFPHIISAKEKQMAKGVFDFE